MWVVQGLDGLILGRFTDIGAFTLINATNGVTIEDEVQIGPHCAILSASTIDNKWGPIHLKKKCCIGTHSTVMPNVTIGENSIIGAHSFVNCDIPANVIAYGIPAKVQHTIMPDKLGPGGYHGNNKGDKTGTILDDGSGERTV